MSIFDRPFVTQIESSEVMEEERQRVAGITPFADAKAEAISLVRGWTRAWLRLKAEDRIIVDLNDPILNSPAEQASIDAIRAAFSNFLTAANAATTLAELNTAWQTYQTDITAI